MSDPMLIDLQMRMMEQEDTIERLNDALVSQQKQIADMQVQLKALQKRLNEVAADDTQLMDATEPPPPHY